MTNDEIVRTIINRFEGQTFTDHPEDPGGATKYGVTRRTLSGWRGKPASREDVQALTFDEAVEIMTALYLTRPKLDRVSDWRVRFVLVDWAIHSGVSTAVRALQTILGNLIVDGECGPATVAVVNAEPNGVLLICRLIAARMEFLGALLMKRPASQAFALGWYRRVGQVLITAVSG